MFAIAITLLILDFNVPPESPTLDLWGHLWDQWPTFFAFITSFLTILITSVNHHRLFNLISRVDTKFLMLSGVLLLPVTFVPYPTALVSEHILCEQAVPAAAL